jgi:DNA-binding transcriptional LysR family regulator
MRHVAVSGRLIVNNADLAVRAALDGLGLAYTTEATAQPFLRTGQLIRVLEDWSPVFEGLFLYYPGQRQVPPALRALIDMIQATRGAGSAKNLPQNPFLQPAEAMETGAAKRPRGATGRIRA